MNTSRSALRRGLQVARVSLLLGTLLGGRAALAAEPAEGGLQWVLPAPAEIKGLQAADPPEQAASDGLFRLINGGASLYLKAGFRRALVQDYLAADGTLFNLEVYEMTSPEAARTVFVHKAGAGVAVGGAGPLRASHVQEYYGLYWEGPFFVSVTGAEPTPEARALFERLAAAVISRARAGQLGGPPVTAPAPPQAAPTEPPSKPAGGPPPPAPATPAQ